MKSGHSSRVSLDDAPVRFSAPRELFRLTEAIEELSARVVAEHEMTASEDSPAPLWQDHPAWPFEEACWAERGTEQWDEALSEVCNALDEDLQLEASMPETLPKLQRLYVLSSFLLIFLDGLTDGVVTAEQWPAVDDYLSDLEKSKRKTSVDEQRTALQEALSQSSGHSISFVLITSMLDRLVQEVHNSSRPKQEPPLSPISPTRMALPFRRMTGLGRVPAAPEREQAAVALAKVFAPVVIKTGNSPTERVRAQQEKRKIETLEVFLRKDSRV
jgi:phosphatidylinositol-bisphosphatase